MIADLHEPFEYPVSLISQDVPRIRLVELLPEQTADHCIRCSIHDYDFDDSCPEYETLSYVWGKKPASYNILVNDESFMITDTLHDALHGLHDPEQSRFLWIDQLTINQSDDREKTQQVAMMRDIYKRASQTVVWLAAPTDGTNLAIAALLRITAATLDGETLKHNSKWNRLGSPGENDTKLLAEPSKDDWGRAKPSRREFNAIGSLIRRPWFRRMWCIQESGVSRSLLVQCGSAKIDFDIMLLGIFMVIISISGSRLRHTLGNTKEFMLMTSVRHQDRGKHLELPELLSATRTFGATDSRDRLYALYGITSTNLEALSLTPDYTIDAREAFTKVIPALIRSQGHLGLLELTEGQATSDANLPSWVPALKGPETYENAFMEGDNGALMQVLETTMRASYRETLKRLEVDPEDVDLEAVEQAFEEGRVSMQQSTQRAMTPMPLLPATTLGRLEVDENQTLHLNGQLVDKIQEISEVVNFPNSGDAGAMHDLVEPADSISEIGGVYKDILFEFRDYVRALVDRDNMVARREKTQKYPNGDSVNTAYWKTVCAGRMHLTEQESERGFVAMRSQLRLAKGTEWLRKTLGREGSWGLGSLTAIAVGGQVSYSAEAKVMWSAWRSSMGRRLAWTAKGYLALIPADAAVGDLVVLLKGGRMPFILRPQAASMRLLGPSYVHGMMGGELMDEDAVGNIKIA